MTEYTSIEFFAGAGGMALGFEQEGIKHVLLADNNIHATNTLKHNRPNWNVICGDIKDIRLNSNVNIMAGGFPCQSFSYAGNKTGFGDIRGTLFHELVENVKGCMPEICVLENVKGLLTHDDGNTLSTIIATFENIGYYILPPTLFDISWFNVPQKRVRLIIVGIRNDLDFSKYSFPYKKGYITVLRDALKKGVLYDTDVPPSPGVVYNENKKRVMELVPEGGCWRDLPVDIQKEYMGISYYASGGKTSLAGRMSWNKPCLTLTCNPAQKKTERCHPEETRPFTIREYARIQTFPDDWEFCGPISQQYRQIGNAVPVNFSREIAKSIIQFLDSVL